MKIQDGGCRCGKVRFRVTAPPLDAGYCHCRMCQRNCGAPVVAWVTFPPQAFPESAMRRAQAFPPAKHTFMASRIIWFQTADELPRHPDYGGPGAALGNGD